ncbi:MAG: glycosyltransferase family 4 protein [Candidatus Eremiobacteraeota bacterium]|nr:glycosyltransferase family 4 protein [Candidatus Eremiobacteraeota bacterium]
MKVALDAQMTVGTATGIGEYARGLTDALRTIGVDVRPLANTHVDPWRFDRRLFWDQVVLPSMARASGADLLHCASGTMPLWRPIPCVVTVHDVAWLRVQAHARKYARWYFGTFALSQYAKALRIIVDSTFSREELLDVVAVEPERVRVVYPGVAAEFAGLIRRPGGKRTIFVPGTLERRKNFEVLLRALVRMPQARVLSAGPFTAYKNECLALAGELGVVDRVRFLGYVPRETLLDLYATADAVAVPSRYEGFGYAAAQALCAGTPVVVADASSLPEIVTDWAPVVGVDDVDAWCGALGRILDEPQAAQERADKVRHPAIERFAWGASARAMRGVYAEALSVNR